ncbi:MAG: hypothetical protein R3D29_12440 [Nitratireductor sp.]
MSLTEIAIIPTRMKANSRCGAIDTLGRDETTIVAGYHKTNVCDSMIVMA